MKTKTIRIFSVVCLLTIYCFSIGSITNSFSFSDLQSNQFSDSQEKFATAFSTNLFLHTSQHENSVNSLNNFPAPTFKNHSHEYWALAKATENLFDTEFSLYTTSFSRKTLINHRKSNIIFPFQYFW